MSTKFNIICSRLNSGSQFNYNLNIKMAKDTTNKLMNQTINITTTNKMDQRISKKTTRDLH